LPQRDAEELEIYLRVLAEKTQSNHRVAQLGAEMRKWKESGHFDFLKERILAPLREESVQSIESAKWTASTIPQVANIQGVLLTMSLIEARMNAIIQEGDNAIAELKDLERSTQSVDENLPGNG